MPNPELILIAIERAGSELNYTERREWYNEIISELQLLINDLDKEVAPTEQEDV